MKYNLLDKINSPKDLKAMPLNQLPQLADELRSFMVDTVSATGGHLAPSLGAVDFTMALYYCLNTPQDKIVWDVGHQAYSHKILTGRKEAFHTLRQKDGISGFPNAGESEYDIFTVGHGSTSISTALGLCSARDLQKSAEKIVAVIGDGSLGGGMALEALNHAGQLRKDLLIILNDNEFSIAPSVGAWSRYLNRVITNPIYNRVRGDVDRLIRRVPKLGFRLAGAARKLEEGLKNLLIPGMLFEEMGIRYFGPVDGHNIPALIEVINNILPLREPRLIHVVTKKGKGFKFAENAPSKFHGTAPFDTKRGEVTVSPGTSFTQAFGGRLTELAGTDSRIVAITAAMPDGTGLAEFAKTFPDRFFNVGMAEGHAVGFAAGLARKGLIPAVAVYSTFLQRAYDQIVHDVALQNLHVIFCIDRAGLVGEDGPTHHGAFDISYLRHIPNLVFMAPKEIEELTRMLEFAIGYQGPVAIRYPRGSVPDDFGVSRPVQRIELGRSELLRAGKDIAIFAIGDMVQPALKASHMLSQDNIHAEVVNMRFIKPIDTDMILRTAERISKFLVIEDNALQGGLGSHLIEVLADNKQHADVERLGLPDRFIAHAKRSELLSDLGLSAEGIAETVRKWLR